MRAYLKAMLFAAFVLTFSGDLFLNRAEGEQT